MDIQDRTPVVTVELQLRPQPPKGSTPWFWGGGMLDFHQRRRRRTEIVWRAELPGFVRDCAARVVQDPDYGWLLMVRYRHAHARMLLAGVGLPECVEGQEAPEGIEARQR
ncbi:MAG TPA: hypothetical protein VNA32_02750 [Actinomycetota bacterium]|nr:hypothetical protein [Actinomycetota bacterium]